MTVVELFAAGFVLAVVLLALLPVVTWTVRQINGLNDRFEILLTAENIGQVLETVPLERLSGTQAAIDAVRAAGIVLQTEHWHCELTRKEAAVPVPGSAQGGASAQLRQVQFVMRFYFDDMNPAPPPLQFEVVRFQSAVP